MTQQTLLLRYNSADPELLCATYKPGMGNSTVSELTCDSGSQSGNVVSVNVTAELDQQFKLKELQILSDVSDHTSWVSWTPWSPCGAECHLVKDSSQLKPMGQQSRHRTCRNFRHTANVCTGERDQTRQCETGMCIDEGEVKLSWHGKGRSNHGLVEIKHNGEWGTICDDSHNITAVSLTACRQLGFETVLRADIGSSWGSSRPGKMWLDELDCFGNETRLDQCNHHPWGKNNCNTNEEVVIKCHGWRARPGEVYLEGAEMDPDKIKEMTTWNGTVWFQPSNTATNEVVAPVCGISDAIQERGLYKSFFKTFASN